MKLLRRKKLGRRTLLRGVAAGGAVAVGLPLLEAMVDTHGEALADGSAFPTRFMTWFWGNGIVPALWTPSDTGEIWQLSEELAPLANVQPYVRLLNGFDNRAPELLSHHEGMTIFNGYPFRDGDALGPFLSNAGGPTIDQLIADVPGMGDCTPIRSVQLGVSKRESTNDLGTTLHNLSHRGYLQPLPPQHYPKDVWAQLFGSFTPPGDPQRPLRIGVLDAVRAQVTKLRQRVGSADAARLDAHLDGLRELEVKIEALPPACQSPPEPSDAENNLDVGGVELLREVSALMSDLLVYALSCDITRVASFLFAEGAGEHVFRELGHDTPHHVHTHDPSPETQAGEVHEGVIYSMEQLAYLCERMGSEADGPQGTLLDNSIIFASSDCSTGWDHAVNAQPMLVIGGGGGKLASPGFHYLSPNGDNPSDVLLALLRLYDPSAASVGADEPMSTTPFELIAQPGG